MKNDMEHPELSVVILCYKTGQFARSFAENVMRMLDSKKISYELILVGNYHPGKQDTTPDVVRDLENKYDRVIAVTKPKQGMMGWDARSGLCAAKGKYICLIDGDEQMPYRDICRVYEKIKSENLDIVKTSRAKREDGIDRLVISFIYNILFNLLFPGMNTWDINSKPKIFRKDAYDKMELVSDDWFLDAEIMIQARRLRLRRGNIWSKFYKCSYRNSFVKPGAIFEFIVNIFKARIREYSVK